MIQRSHGVLATDSMIRMDPVASVAFLLMATLKSKHASYCWVLHAIIHGIYKVHMYLGLKLHLVQDSSGELMRRAVSSHVSCSGFTIKW